MPLPATKGSKFAIHLDHWFQNAEKILISMVLKFYQSHLSKITEFFKIGIHSRQESEILSTHDTQIRL